MKKQILLIYIMCACLGVGCTRQQAVVAPDGVFAVANGRTLLVADRKGCELLALSPEEKATGVTPVDKWRIAKRIPFPAPVNDLTEDAAGRLWAVCEGTGGRLYELSPADYSVVSEAELGATPSAILFNPLGGGTLWTTQRFLNEVWVVNPATKAVEAKIPVGREPVDMVAFAGDSCLLVVNNLPEASSLAFPVAAQLDVVDVFARKVVKHIPLPNGSTDVKAVAIDVGRRYAYVTHLLARYQLPTNQVDRGWMSTNALSIIDLETREHVTTVLLDTPQKGTANPWQIAVTPDDLQLVIAASGTHELVMIDRAGLHNRLKKARRGEQVTPSLKGWEYIPDDAGFLYGLCRFVSTGGKGPRSVVVAGGRFYTANYYTGELVSVDFAGNVSSAQPLGTPLASTSTGRGDMFFHDATLGFQGWQSCASCHPNDARMDGLNWDLLNDGMGNPKNTKTLLFSHQTPPCMVTGIRRDAETAVRSGIKYILFAQTDDEVARAMDEYLRSLRPVPSPRLVDGELSPAARRGKVLFDKSCASCHSGAYYTDGQQYAVSWATGADSTVKMDVPSLNECWRTAPYLYDGRSYTMRDMLKVHGPKEPHSGLEIDDLAEYVLSL